MGHMTPDSMPALHLTQFSKFQLFPSVLFYDNIFVLFLYAVLRRVPGMTSQS